MPPEVEEMLSFRSQICCFLAPKNHHGFFVIFFGGGQFLFLYIFFLGQNFLLAEICEIAEKDIARWFEGPQTSACHIKKYCFSRTNKLALIHEVQLVFYSRSYKTMNAKFPYLAVPKYRFHIKSTKLRPMPAS